jgi:hypothetical protein
MRLTFIEHQPTRLTKRSRWPITSSNKSNDIMLGLMQWQCLKAFQSTSVVSSCIAASHDPPGLNHYNSKHWTQATEAPRPARRATHSMPITHIQSKRCWAQKNDRIVPVITRHLQRLHQQKRNMNKQI